uniref:Serine/threonine-protein phosphatase 4 regulatory subunit 3-like central domain-containing protein n=1 Tax=Clastoptera arizonana TaxID=38151 RepID=A0A1B6CNK5_9HEMI
MICDTDPELGRAVQLMGILRILIDPESMLASINKSEKTDFLDYFYNHSIHLLIAPLLANTIDNQPAKDDYQTVQLLGLILELLSFCVEHHTYNIKNCISNKDLLRRILVLMKSTHMFLVLCALRFMRKIIALKDEHYNRYIVKGDLFLPVIDAFIRNNGRYNLLDSAILEMFEFIKLEDIKILCSHVVENFGKILDEVEYVQTFKNLKNRYNQHQDKKERGKTSLDSVPSILRNNRYRRDTRQLEEEEEMWFNDEEDLDDGEAVVPANASNIINKKLNTELDNLGKSEKKSEGSSAKLFSNATKTAIINNNLSSITASATPGDVKCSGLYKRALVDYEGDSDEEEEEGGELLPPPKRGRFS